jgi:8-oxo-dGTP pyrophosphatase MutT (NUDIX family)
MLQMYEVFINDKTVKFCNESKMANNYPNAMVAEVFSRKMLKENFSEFLKSGVFDILVFRCGKNPEKYFEDFISLFWYLAAAGGVVRNQSNERLFIYRFGKWDLPKGKIEKGESPAEAAVREVIEETGLPNPELIAGLPSTYHIYEYKGKKVVKRTFWYSMKYNGTLQPVPQTEEGITEARWFKPEDYKTVQKNTYASLLGLIGADLQL